MFGGGFRSVPPTDLPAVVLEPGQMKPLTTRLVSLTAPGAGSGLALPASGESLRLGDIAELGASSRVQDVLRRLAREKAPEAVAQLALWGAAGMPWDEVARASRGWANGYELALARSLVDRIDRRAGGDPGRLMVEVTPKDSGADALAEEIRAALRDRSMLGLAVEPGMPARPEGPAVGCGIRVNGTSAEPELVVELASSDDRGEAWTPVGKFSIPVVRDATGRLDPAKFGDALAEGLVDRLVVATLRTARGSKPKAKEHFTIQVENRSPLILNGITLSGADVRPDEPARSLVGIGVAPRRSFALPASADAVEKAGLKRGLRVAAVGPVRALSRPDPGSRKFLGAIPRPDWVVSLPGASAFGRSPIAGRTARPGSCRAILPIAPDIPSPRPPPTPIETAENFEDGVNQSRSSGVE